MRQQMTHGDLLAKVLELGNVLSHVVVQRELAPRGQQGEGESGELL